MGEMEDVLNEEVPTYTFGGLISDIGGAMGLLLGLSILDLLAFSSVAIQKIARGIVSVKRSMVNLLKNQKLKNEKPTDHALTITNPNLY